MKLKNKNKQPQHDEYFFKQEVGEELDPALRPIVMQETVRRGGQVVMKLGDTEIEYNSNFRYGCFVEVTDHFF